MRKVVLSYGLAYLVSFLNLKFAIPISVLFEVIFSDKFVTYSLVFNLNFISLR